MTDAIAPSNPLKTFLDRWARSGAAERANHQLFLSELCDVIGVARPEPTGAEERDNTYVFEELLS